MACGHRLLRVCGVHGLSGPPPVTTGWRGQDAPFPSPVSAGIRLLEVSSAVLGTPACGRYHWSPADDHALAATLQRGSRESGPVYPRGYWGLPVAPFSFSLPPLSVGGLDLAYWRRWLSQAVRGYERLG